MFYPGGGIFGPVLQDRLFSVLSRDRRGIWNPTQCPRYKLTFLPNLRSPLQSMLTPRQARELTGVPSGRLILLALTGQLPSSKDPKTKAIVFEEDSLRAWAKTHTHQAQVG